MVEDDLVEGVREDLLNDAGLPFVEEVGELDEGVESEVRGEL